ncbi:MAG: DUF2510 domain-containing protein [Pseudolysinimonas sp.]
MSTSLLLSPAPGWYPDPAAEAAFRWWDGDTWTEGTHAAISSTDDRAPIQLFADPEPEAPEPAAQPVMQPTPAPQMQPAQHPATPPGPEVRRTPRGVSPAKTRWSSLLLAFPFVYPLAVGMVVALAYAGGAASNQMALVIVGAVVAIALLIPAWVFAEQDRRELLARGYEPAPSIGWMALLPPIAYLIARRRVVGPSY